MGKVNDDNICKWYIEKTIKNGWSSNVYNDLEILQQVAAKLILPTTEDIENRIKFS